MKIPDDPTTERGEPRNNKLVAVATIDSNNGVVGRLTFDGIQEEDGDPIDSKTGSRFKKP